MKTSAHGRGRPAARVVAMCLTAAAVALVPSLAVAADAGAPTIRAQVGGDGSVDSAKQITSDGSSSDFGGQLPVSMKITHTASGDSQTYSYHVENTFSQTQTVNYTDTAGQPHHASVQLQLPLVAQLGVDVPADMGSVDAGTATVTQDANGTRHVLWTMILFTPLGTAAQDVSLTTSKAGTPVAELRATSVNPTSTPGLSASSQSATASYQQDDFWAGYANGGNEGLSKLSAGMGQLVDGLGQLLTGISSGASGAKQLADGSAQAHTGSVQLSNGIGKIHNGQGKLTNGLGQLHGGLDQLAAGMPAALDGVKQLKAGVSKLIDGVGDDTTDGTLINGVDQLSGGLDQLVAAFGVWDPTDPTDPKQAGIAFGIRCAQDAVDLIVNGNATATKDICFASLGGSKPQLPKLSTVPGTAFYSLVLQNVLDQALTPINDAMKAQVVPGLQALAAGAKKVRAGLSTGSMKNPGLKEGLIQVEDGLVQLKSGLGDAATGVDKLDAGSGAALQGSKKLYAGSGQAFSGSKDLVSGLAQIASGNAQVAAGLPAAVTGVQQLIDGGTQVKDGIGQVQSQATEPLEKQLKQSSINSHKQIAILNSAAALADKGPGGAGASYVLTQSEHGYSLAAASTSATSNTGRDVGIAIGAAVVALLVGLGGGIAIGRQRRAAA